MVVESECAVDELPAFLDGPEFVTWLEAQGVERQALSDAEKRRWYEWENGLRAYLYSDSVDGLMTRYGIPIGWIPDELWSDDQRHHTGRQTDYTETVELLESGRSVPEIAAVLGVQQQTVRRRRKRLVERGMISPPGFEGLVKQGKDWVREAA